MISYKRKYLHALVTFIVAGAIGGSGSPVNLYLGFPVLANVLYVIALLLLMLALYYLATGWHTSHEYKRSISAGQNESPLQCDQKKRSVARRSFFAAVIIYLVSWFILTGASSAKLANDAEKEPILMYLLGLIGVLMAFYFSFRGARLFYIPISEAEE